ncbi:hypothetical protein [Paenibacillus sp. XY044]|uniref:hypothetical protein n=1 Tax=Paenibacillus sp. XY044 TaxID=2026089 RepID=UPI000B97D5A7|nr:hypothetical protein [Paenibacillus sp. XY044]OZB98103.1 hypothetical protein CJP46_02745 [Paenibacillus sp. XY044]
MNLLQVIEEMNVGDIAFASFDFFDYWHILKREDGAIVYCEADGKHQNEIVGLTYSNLNSSYRIL